MAARNEIAWGIEEYRRRVVPDDGAGLLLTLFEEAIGRLERALELLSAGAATSAAPLVLDSQFLLYALAESCAGGTDRLSRDLSRLYEFCLHRLGSPSLENVQAVLGTLKTLKDGFEGIREEAGPHGLHVPEETGRALDLQL